MAAGDEILDENGDAFLQTGTASGNLVLSNGVNNDCCCCDLADCPIIANQGNACSHCGTGDRTPLQYTVTFDASWCACKNYNDSFADRSKQIIGTLGSYTLTQHPTQACRWWNGGASAPDAVTAGWTIRTFNNLDCSGGSSDAGVGAWLFQIQLDRVTAANWDLFVNFQTTGGSGASMIIFFGTLHAPCCCSDDFTIPNDNVDTGDVHPINADDTCDEITAWGGGQALYMMLGGDCLVEHVP